MVTIIFKHKTKQDISFKFIVPDEMLISFLTFIFKFLNNIDNFYFTMEREG